MSLKPQNISPVPEETARMAHAAYPKGNVSMHMRDVLGTLYEDASFAHLLPNNGQPAEAAWRLALVTIMQFVRSDSQIDKPLMGCEDALIGSMLSTSN